MLGRDEELREVARFLDRAAVGPASLLLEGEAGIGKTTLWQAGIDLASQRGSRVLAARAAESEAQLSFTSLGDLLEDAVGEVVGELPRPRSRALEAALLLAEVEHEPPDPRAVGVAVLDVLRALARRGPLLVAVDDVQWLDPPSSRALGFALRRLREERVGFLVTRRKGLGEDGGTAALVPDGVHHLVMGPLPPTTLGPILRSQTGRDLPKPVLSRLHGLSGGNPFFALELARALITEDGLPQPGEPWPVPEDLGQLLRARVDALGPEAGDALIIAAAAGRPTVDLVRMAFGDDARADAGLSQAQTAGVVAIDDGRIRFTHPLLAATVYAGAPLRRRRGAHRRLAEVVNDPEGRARHLAIVAEGPDPWIASALDEAARHARARGAPDAAAELCELARRLTPEDDVQSARRRTDEAARYHFGSGNTRRARELLTDLLSTAVEGNERARLLNRLSMFAWYDMREVSGLLRRGLEEEPEDLRVLVRLLSNRAWCRVFGGGLDEGLRLGRAAAETARRIRDQKALADALSVVGWAEFWLGSDAGTIMAEAAAIEDGLTPTPDDYGSAVAYRGAQQVWAGDLDGARIVLEQEHARDLDRGMETTRWEALAFLAELECRAGNLERAERRAEECDEVLLEAGLEAARDVSLFVLALVEAHVGHVERCRAHAEEGLHLAERHENVFYVIALRSVLGFLELSLGDAASAYEWLGPLPDIVERMGMREPGVFPFVPDLVEALASLGRPDEAEPHVAWLEERSRALDRPLGLATAARCRAMLSAARGDPVAGLEHLDEALREHERCPQPIELARTRLVQGAMLRRARRRRDAAEALRRGLDIFERVGAVLWAERARAELARSGAVVGGPDDLTPSERRVADLAVQGLTNREIADTLFLSVKTVEANLSRVYRKLGVRGRAELARFQTEEGSPPRVASLEE